MEERTIDLSNNGRKRRHEDKDLQLHSKRPNRRDDDSDDRRERRHKSPQRDSPVRERRPQKRERGESPVRERRQIRDDRRPEKRERRDSPARERHQIRDDRREDRDRSRSVSRGRSRSVSMEVQRLPEQTERFEIKAKSILETFDETHKDLQPCPVVDENRIKKAEWCSEETLHRLWHQKSRMDAIFDKNHGDEYYRVREEIFPQDKKGSNRFWNRAGDKLMQVVEAVDLFAGMKSTTFIDICGGPGAFTQVMLECAPKPTRGYGMTLEVAQTPTSDTWYRKLRDCPHFTILKGEDGTGNVYNPANLEHVIKAIEEGGDKEKVNMFVGDGGFEIKKTDDGTHMENLQELFSARIILSEFLLMMRTLNVGGHFVCKIFDTSSHISASLIYILTLVFEKVYVVKPLRSRIVNSERYVVGKYMRRHGRSHGLLTEMLQKLHQRCWDEQQADVLKEMTPLSVLPLQQMLNDSDFVHTLRDVNETISRKQTIALRVILNDVEKSLEEEEEETAARPTLKEETKAKEATPPAPKEEELEF